jgi:hypothetical protein
MSLPVQILGFLIVACALVSVLLAIYYVIMIVGGVRPQWKRIAMFLGPFVLVLPPLLNDPARRALPKLLASLLVFALCFWALVEHFPRGLLPHE